MSEPGARSRRPEGLPAARLAQVRQLSDPVRVLVGDRDVEVIEGLRRDLAPMNVEILESRDGAQVLFDAGLARPQVFLLCADLPVVGAVDVVRTLKVKTDAYVIVGAGEGQVALAAAAMKAGADRMMQRPYPMAELPDVLRNVTRGLARVPTVLRAGSLSVDPLAYEVRLGNEVIPMPVRELEVLVYLLNHQDRIVTVTELRETLWANEPLTPKSNAVAVTILHLRSRFGARRGPELIRTIRRLGYRFHAPSEEPREA